MAGPTARMEEVCLDSLADLERRGTAGWQALQAWRKTVGEEEQRGGLDQKSQRELNQLVDRPREVMDLLKEEILAQRQDELLGLIRGAPGWGFD